MMVVIQTMMGAGVALFYGYFYRESGRGRCSSRRRQRWRSSLSLMMVPGTVTNEVKENWYVVTLHTRDTSASPGALPCLATLIITCSSSWRHADATAFGLASLFIPHHPGCSA